MELREERRDGVLLLTPVGRLDSNTSQEFETRLMPLLRGGAGGVVVDLGAVDYVSSAGLRVLLLAVKELSAARRPLVLSRPAPAVRQVFALSGVMSFFAVEPDVDAAVAKASATA